MARPKEYRGKPLKVRLTQKQREELERIAECRNKTMGDIVRWSLNRLIQQRSSLDVTP